MQLNLGINWGWKERKLTDSPSHNSHHVTHIPIIGGTPDSNSQSGLGYPGREVSTSQQTISSAVPGLQKNKVFPDTTSQSNVLPPEHNNQLVDGCKKSAAVDLSLSATNSTIDQREPASLVPAKRSRCESKAIQGPIVKKPKHEPVDFSQQQLPGFQAESIFAPQFLCKTNLPHQRIEAEKILHERFTDKRGSLRLINNGQQEILKGNTKLSTGMPTSTVKQEPTEIPNFPDSDSRKINYKFSTMDMRSNQSNLQQKKFLQPSPSLRTYDPLTSTLLNHVVRPDDKSLGNEIATQKRKVLPNPQATVGVRPASLSSHINSSPREASVPTKRKKKGSSTNVLDSLVGISNLSAAKGSSPSFGNSSFHLASDVEGNPYLARFLKIGEVAQRWCPNYSHILCTENCCIFLISLVLMRSILFFFMHPGTD